MAFILLFIGFVRILPGLLSLPHPAPLAPDPFHPPHPVLPPPPLLFSHSFWNWTEAATSFSHLVISMQTLALFIRTSVSHASWSRLSHFRPLPLPPTSCTVSSGHSVAKIDAPLLSCCRWFCSIVLIANARPLQVHSMLTLFIQWPTQWRVCHKHNEKATSRCCCHPRRVLSQQPFTSCRQTGLYT